MDSLILENELSIRSGFFLSIFLAMAGWEYFCPRRKLIASKTQRWFNNLGLVVLNNVVVRLVLPAGAVGMAIYVEESSMGILNNWQLPNWLEVIVAVMFLDLVIYLQHVMFHALPLLWKLHRVHHADPDFDVTTGLRFHPFEILLSMLIKLAAIFLLGPSVVAVIMFEVLLNGTAMFNHGNVKISKSLDSFMRWFVVTPDMHRVHHSVEEDETNSNFGFNLPWWDRLFGTYRMQPRKGHELMEIGVHTLTDPKRITALHGMLILPFVHGDINTTNKR